MGGHSTTIVICSLVIFLIHSSTQSISDSQTDSITTNNGFSAVHRAKRTAVRGQRRYYPYGIVPYSFDRRVTARQRRIIRSVMEQYQNLTCIRFVPKILPDGQWAKYEYNLGHNGYIEFVNEHACFGGIGRSNGKTTVSCCERDSCIHEIGHTLGQVHEHQNPNRDGFIRINTEYMRPVRKIRYMISRPSDVLDDFPFDVSSPMNYDFGGTVAKVQLLTTDVSTEEKDFYMFEEISVTHRCRENNCSNFNMECFNDGYITMVQGSCACRCPEGLNPDTGCRTVLSEDRAQESCGGVFDLTDANPTATFTKPRNTNVECSWLINAPAGDTIKLDFNEFNIQKQNDDCVDKLEIRHSRIGQGGKYFCGTVAPRMIKSYFNHVMVTFLPQRLPRPRSNFNATARLVSARTLCYNPQDKGYTYAGTVDYTRDHTKCIEWWKAAHCPHNPYNFKDLESNMNNNYCRNPGNGVTPWCYTWAPGCQRRYCDVCMLDQPPPDRARRCIRWTRFGYCNNYKEDARWSCATTCASSLFPVQLSALNVTCHGPPSLSDSDQIDKLNQTSFAVGDFVTFRCRHVNRLFRTELKKYCLTSGNWTVGNTACLPCPMHKGYDLYNGSCYAVQTQSKTANQHQRTCKAEGGHLADVKTMEEQKYITNLAFAQGLSNFYIGPNDMRQEGVFRYRSDNSSVTWTNWNRYSNNRGNTDCVWTTLMYEWAVGGCGRRLKAVCKTPMLRHQRRRLAACSDSRDDCRDLLDKDVQMCDRARGDFGVTQCPLTCGKCI